MVGIRITDTIENWQNTIDHCDNTPISCTNNGDGTLTKVYGTNPELGFARQAMFGRLRGSSDPTIPNILKREVGNPIIDHFAYWDGALQSTWNPAIRTTETYDYCTADERSFQPVFYNVCIGDDVTPQACLDKWTTDFDLTSWISNYNDCFIRKVFDNSISKTHDYVIIYGGCDSRGRTLDAWYNFPASTWAGTTFATSSKSYKYPNLNNFTQASCTAGNVCHAWNIKSATPGTTGAKDRIGFRIPKGGWSGFGTSNFWGPTV